MKKIPSLFKCNYGKDVKIPVTEEVNPESDWVIQGYGEAYLKHDGTACLVKDGKLFARYDAKRGKTPPKGAIPCQDPDPITGHWPHWVEVTDDNPAYKHHLAAFEEVNKNGGLYDGTYELCGPHFQSNPHKFEVDLFVPHKKRALRLVVSDRSFEWIREILKNLKFEGLVFHHVDGRMAKVRRDQFGFDWPIRSET